MAEIWIMTIPASGHTNPLLPLAKELKERGHSVRFFGFDAWKSAIEETGAAYISMDPYLPEEDRQQIKKIQAVNTTAMTMNALATVEQADGFLQACLDDYPPDLIISDSVCFWGKLLAMRHQIPLLVSTTTFAFNKESSRYMKSSIKEIWNLVTGMSKMQKRLDGLCRLGYPKVKLMELVQSSIDQHALVYTSKAIQPAGETFPATYCFCGAGLPKSALDESEAAIRARKKQPPLVYIALGTILNDQPDFYERCVQALQDLDVRIVIAAGAAYPRLAQKTWPDHVRLEQRTDQKALLKEASCFLTHCGMNSVSESIWALTPMVLYPLTNEERAVAARMEELGAGVVLKKGTPDQIRRAVEEVLRQPRCQQAVSDLHRTQRESGLAGKGADFAEGMLEG